MTDLAVKQCPYCKEDIRANAIKCKHCGSDLGVAPPLLSYEGFRELALDPTLIRSRKAAGSLGVIYQEHDPAGPLDDIGGMIKLIGCDLGLLLAFFHLKLAVYYDDQDEIAKSDIEIAIFVAIVLAGLEAGCE